MMKFSLIGCARPIFPPLFYNTINHVSLAQLWKLSLFKFLKHVLVFPFFFFPSLFDAQRPALRDLRNGSLHGKSRSHLWKRKKKKTAMFSVAVFTLIMDAYDIAFEEFLLTPAKHHVNTKHCSNYYFFFSPSCEQMYFTSGLMWGEWHTRRGSEAEKKKEKKRGVSSIPSLTGG